MKTFLALYRTELIKTKNSFALWLVILGAAFIPFFFFLNHVYDWDDYLPKPGENPWDDYVRKGFNGNHFTFLPLLVILLVALLLNIEHKSNTWKHIFVLPVSKTKIFLSKYLLLFSLIILFYCLLLIFLFSGGLFLSLWKNQFNFLKYRPSYVYASIHSGIAAFVVKSFISTLAIIAIHFWLSFRLKNLFVNIGIGLAGVVIAVSMYIPHWPSIVYLPYAFPVLMCNFIPDVHHFLSNFQVNSLLFFSVIFFLSYFDFIRRFKG
ncbi:MAG: ABC transporter permease [Ginsengibacter sp.]